MQSTGSSGGGYGTEAIGTGAIGSEGTAMWDGNLLAGPLSEIFAVDITTAVGRCRGCGSSSTIASTVRSPGSSVGVPDATTCSCGSSVRLTLCGSTWVA